MQKNYINDHEYSDFSQNGEDGIIDLLLSYLLKPSNFFVEIGCGNGLENNSTHLILKGYRGLVCDMPYNIKYYGNLLKLIKPKEKIATVAGIVDLENIQELIKTIAHQDIDFFSLDIDSYDFFIMQAIMQGHIFPKVICVEYNAFLGHDPLSLRYIKNFQRYRLDTQCGLCYGASLSAWKLLFESYGYRFVCVDSSGVNAFFVLDQNMSASINEWHGLEFEYTKGFLQKYQTDGKTLENHVLSNFKDSLIDIRTLL